MCVNMWMSFSGLGKYVSSLSQNQTVIEKKYYAFMSNLVDVLNKFVTEHK